MKKISIIVLVLLAIGLGYWLISPLFRNIKVDEPVPTADMANGTAEQASVPANADNSTNDSNNLVAPAYNSIDSNVETSIDVGDKIETLEQPKASGEQSTAPAPLVGTSGHPASGTARVVTVGGKSYLRYENFKTINGPDIFVYLSTDLEATEFVNLGKVKATEGNVNYEIPSDVNPADYPYVIIWCRAFGVLFNSAKVY